LDLYVDIDRCIYCHACEVACERVHGESRISVGGVEHRASVPVLCHHCDPAPCSAVCPEGGLVQGESAVTFEAEKCTGCGLCTIACPFGAAYLGEAGGIQKCDLCPEMEVPACVLTCPAEALVWGDGEERAGMVRRRAAGRVAQSYADAAGRDRISTPQGRAGYE